MVLSNTKEVKEFFAHIADAFSVSITAMSGFNLLDIKLFAFQPHDVFQSIVFYMGGVFSLMWLAFRAAKGYYDFKNSKKEYDDD